MAPRQTGTASTTYDLPPPSQEANPQPRHHIRCLRCRPRGLWCLRHSSSKDIQSITPPITPLSDPSTWQPFGPSSAYVPIRANSIPANFALRCLKFSLYLDPPNPRLIGAHSN